MNPPSTLYAMLQVMAMVLIFLSAFLALFLCMILCLIAAELSCAGISFVRTRVAKRPSFHPLVAPERQAHAQPAGRRVGVVH